MTGDAGDAGRGGREGHGPPDRWLVLRVPIPDDDDRTAVLSDALVELGGRAVWENEGLLVTHVPEPDDPDAFVARARRELSEAVAEDADPSPEVELRTEWQDHEEWSELWKRGLRARRLTERIVVTPSWIPVDPGPDDLVVTVDPGMAFGNAEHGTTRGCIRLLDGTVAPGERLLDVGAGSGILSIVAVLLGAGDVVALEADPWAVEPAEENLRANGVADRVELREARVDADDLRALGPRDGAMANMEFGVLRPLVPGLAAAVRPGGWLLLSGVLDHEWDDLLAEAGALGLRLEARDADGEWRSGLFRSPETPA